MDLAGFGEINAKLGTSCIVVNKMSTGAFVPEVYYNVQVAQTVTISNEDKKYDFYVS